MAPISRPTSQHCWPRRDRERRYPELKGQIQGAISNNAIRVIKTLKPHQRGNRILWRLHVLNKEDKHNILIPVRGVLSKFEASITAFQGVKLDITRTLPILKRVPLKENAIIHRIPATDRNRPDVDMNPKFTFDIAFRKGKLLQGYTIIGELNEFASTVDQTLKLFIPLL